MAKKVKLRVTSRVFILYNLDMTAEKLPNHTEVDSTSSTSLASGMYPELELPAPFPSLDDPKLFVNRELSLLSFQGRVLEEAKDQSNPLLERVRFLSIVGSNLDEFFMVRVAGLKRQVEAGNTAVGIDGLSPGDQLKTIRFEVAALLQRAHRYYKNEISPQLLETGVSILQYSELNEGQKAKIREYFHQNIFPILTPLGYDPGHPFPHISNLSLNLAVLIKDNLGEERFARVKVPDSLPQLIRVDDPASPLSRRNFQVTRTQTFIWLDDLISAHLDFLFPGMEIVESHPFHVTRDAEMEIQEWEAGDLLETTEESIRQRRFGDVVRLEVNPGIPNRVLEILVENLEIEPADIYWVEGRLPLSMLKHICVLDRPDLKYPSFLPAIPAALNPDSQEEDLFSVLKRRDVLVHHPYDSFQPVVNFLTQSVRDPNVQAMKITLYRVGNNSPIVDALLRAPEKGKQVAVLVELKARFDEKSNIEWAKAMERQGVHVVYGLLGLKVHAKISLIVRKEGDR
ncbi:MAG: polyphosphate kinase 1, partial [Leptolyngbya sp.]|nr:polyphosphate kinase 1 [Candidatus Melainabacteria bacterium]